MTRFMVGTGVLLDSLRSRIRTKPRKGKGEIQYFFGRLMGASREGSSELYEFGYEGETRTPL